MENTKNSNIKLWKKVMCTFLSIIIAFGTFVTITFGNSKFQKWLGVRSMLSAYAAEIVDTKGAIAVDEDTMIADDHTICLENRDGSNTVYLFSEPISYTDENGDIKTKDISVEKADNELKSKGYDYTNGQNDYRINFSKDQRKGIEAIFEDCSYSIIPLSTTTAEGTESVAEYLDENFEVFQYKNIYGNGTNLRFYPQLNGVKDEIILNQNIDVNSFSFELKTKNCTAQLNGNSTISLINSDGSTIQTFAAPFAYDNEYVEGDMNSHYIDCEYSLTKKNDTSYIMTITVPNEWLISESTQYPVIIDPTTSNISASADAGVYSKYSSNNYGSEQTCCFGKASDYGYGSFYTKFTVPTAIKKGAKINSAYQWMRETTGRTTTTYVTPYMVTSSWSETGIKWSNKASYNTSVAGTKKNINSKSTDDPDNSYWYKFNIAGAVKKWVDGTSNYGVAYVSSDANSSGAYNWRAFTSRTYSSSAMRPYTVINYTNDVTAPTVTSVTGNPTSWTKNNVTLTVNGAKDNSGGAGLHSTPYSFSTTKGSYSWQSGKTKVISSNCTVYVYVRDAYSNIRLVSTQTINKIDKLKPSTPTATLSKTDWSQSNISITVKSDDAAATSSNGKSGVKYYCCTQTTTPTDWKSVSTLNSSYTFTNIGNGTYNLYAKDQAGNISSPKTIKISCVDPEAPVVNEAKVYTEDTTKESCIHILASDETSGINAYSINGGQDWIAVEPTKLLDVNIDPKLYDENEQIDVRVKDQSGRISNGRIIPLKTPKFYEYNGLVGIYNPNNNKTTVQYKIGEDGEWTKYKNPFDVPLGNTSTIYTRLEGSDAEYKKTVTPDFSSVNTYSESNTDFSLSHKNLSFDFIRTYNSSKNSWFYSTDSKVEVVNDYVIKAIMPDSTELVFVKTENNKYIDEINGYTLTVENGYVIEIDDISYIYDTNRMIKEIRDNYNNVITVNRTSSSIIIKDKANRTYTINLDSNGNITTVTDPANNTITYTFDSNNKLTQVVDQAGVTISQYSYTNDVLTKSMDKNINYRTDGRVASYVYDSGAYTNYSYDDENMTVSTENSVGETTSQTYNDAFMTVSSTNEDGNTTEYTYDEHYRTVSETSDGATVTYTYDDKGNLLSEVSDDEDAENTYYTYDLNGNVIRQQTGTAYTYYVYNENDELTLSATLKEDYDGEVPNSYNSDLTCFDTVSYTYNTDGTLQQTVDSKNNEIVSYTYDDYGNTVKTTTVTENDGESTVGVVDYTYDIMGNLLTSVSGDETSSYIYDSAGRTLLANEKGDCTRTIYDNLGRVVREIGPEDYDGTKDGLPEENTYSDENAGHTYEYDDNNRLIKEINRLGKESEYSYHSNGEKSYEKFDIYEFFYNEHSDITEIKISDVTTVSYTYQNATKNDIEYRLVLESYANGDTIYNYYDIDTDNIVGISHNADGPFYVTYTYNVDGDLTEKVNTDTGLKYVYDGDNVSVYKTSDNSLVQSYTSTETEANEETGTEAYTTVTENHFGTEYTSVSREKSVSYTACTNTAEYSYQTTGTDEDEKLSADTVKYNDSVILSSAYTYDDNGNVLSKSYGESNVFTNTYDDKDRITSTSYAGKTYNYTYDTDSQLTGVTGNNYTASYEYDNRGNIINKTVNDETTTFTYANSGWKDLLVSVNGTELTYDANGNVLTYGNKVFTWNTGRNLAQITDGENTYSYTYDEEGIRTSKTVNGVTTYYNTKDGVILSQTDGTNTMYFQYDTSGAPLGFIYNGTQYFYMTNQMGDVISITDNQGNELVKYEYDEWGNTISVYPTISNDEQQLSLADANPLRYRGYYLDKETGYYYLQSRYYDSGICRFINADIPEIAQMSKDIPVGTNSFAYCNNNPINNRDITGDIPLIASLIIGAIVGVILLYVVDIISNLANKRNMWKRVSSYSDYVSAAISGALSMVSIKKFSSLITASISSITYICNCIESGKKFDFLSLVVIVLIDLAFGVLAGKGVNLTNKVGIIKTSKKKLKTLVSPKKIAQYEKKIINAKKDIIKRSIRNAFAAIASKLQEKVREYFGSKTTNKFLKRLALAGL